MPKTFELKVEWTGYCRGTSTYQVEADSKEEAEESLHKGKRTHHDVVRDDTEKDIVSITEMDT